MNKSWGSKQFQELMVQSQDKDRAKEEEEEENATKAEEMGEVSTKDHTKKIPLPSLICNPIPSNGKNPKPNSKGFTLILHETMAPVSLTP